MPYISVYGIISDLHRVEHWFDAQEEDLGSCRVQNRVNRSLLLPLILNLSKRKDCVQVAHQAGTCLPFSVAGSDEEYFYSPLDAEILVHPRVNYPPAFNSPVPI